MQFYSFVKIETLTYLVPNGQIISKCLFGVFNFFQKWTKTCRILVKMNEFIHFLEEFTAWQLAFEINWPLPLFGLESRTVLKKMIWKSFWWVENRLLFQIKTGSEHLQIFLSSSFLKEKSMNLLLRLLIYVGLNPFASNKYKQMWRNYE